MMSKIIKKLKVLLKWISDERGSISYMSHEKPKIYPYKFKNRAEQEAHDRKLDLDLTINMFL